MILSLLLLVFVLALMFRFPIAFALALSCLSYLLVKGIPLIIIPLKLYSGIDVFVLLSIPGFILAGNLMNHGGLTEKIITFCNHLIGHIRGGLSLANIFSSMIFAGISGTAVADTASIGAVMIPAMRKEGYSPEFAAAVTASSSTVGPIIPPSVPMIIAGTLTGISIGKLFLAGMIPGLLLGIGMMLTSWLISQRKRHPKLPRSTSRQIFKGFVDTFWALLMTVIILFGIVGGVFTPTEASIIAVMYALGIGYFVYKKLTPKNIPVIVLDSLKTSASLMLLVGFANLFGWILITEQLPQHIAAQLLNISDNKFVILLLINVLLLFVGTFMETIAALLILLPILLKVALAVDIDPLHFSVVVVLNLIIGLTTPPVGVCLFVASSIARIPILRVSSAGLPFFIVNFLILLAVSYISALSLFVPGLFYE